MTTRHESPLISAEELAGSLDDVTLLDVRWRMGGPPGREEFARGHLPGAAYVDLDADLAAPPDPAVGTRSRTSPPSSRRCGRSA